MADTPQGGTPDSRPFAAAWDDYAARSSPTEGKWAGDEWGDEKLWDAWFRRLCLANGAAQWKRVIEVGQGTGKYTRRILSAGGATLLALDVSDKFLALCGERLREFVEKGRLLLRKIDERDADPLARAAREVGWERDVDAVVSIDTLVHLSVSQVAALLLSATSVLRPGGRFIATFADATSAAGLAKLTSDLVRVTSAAGEPASGCFQWASPDLVRAIATGYGYRVDLCETDPEHRRDGHFVLTFADPEVANAMRVRRDGAA